MRFQLAVFGINGPISASPRNYIWMRTAALEFHPARRERAEVERVAGGFEFTEGPRVVAATARCCSARRTPTRSTGSTPNSSA